MMRKRQILLNAIGRGGERMQNASAPSNAWIGASRATAIAVTLFFIASPFLSEDIAAATTNKIVYGTVYDQVGNAISGADVTVEIWGGWWPDQDFFRISKSTVTNPAGSYQVTISSNFWDPHNTIKVIVVYETAQETTKVEADGEEFQEVNVYMNFTIPEFIGFAGVLAVLAGCVIPVAILLSRRRR